MANENAKYKLKTGDKVIILNGKDKGKTGEITAFDRKNGKVKVAGANIATKHQKPNQMQGGGIVKQEAFLDVSNVAFLDDKSGKGVKLAYKVEGDKKVRINRKTGEAV